MTLAGLECSVLPVSGVLPDGASGVLFVTTLGFVPSLDSVVGECGDEPRDAGLVPLLDFVEGVPECWLGVIGPLVVDFRPGPDVGEPQLHSITPV